MRAPTSVSPPSSTPAVSSVRPPASRANSRPSRRIDAVGSSSAEIVDHLGPTVDGDPDGPRQRAGQLDGDPRSFGRFAEFADDVAHRGGDLVERQPRGRAAELRIRRRQTGAVADVLLMHPAIEEPHPHEPAETLQADRAGSRRIPIVDRHGGQHIAPSRRDRAEPLQQSISGLRAEVTDPDFVGRADVVADVVQRRQIDVGVGRAEPLQRSTRCRSCGRRRRARTSRAAASVSATAARTVRSAMSSRLSQVPNRPDNTSDLSRMVTGRDMIGS